MPQVEYEDISRFDWLKCFSIFFCGKKRAQLLQIESEGRRSAVTYSKTTLCASDQCSSDAVAP